MDKDQKKLYYGIIAIMVVVAIVSVIVVITKNSKRIQQKIIENSVLSKQSSSITTNVVNEDTAE
jgi:uncharacterized membrane protein